MNDDVFSEDEQKQVNFLNPPESTPEGAQDFSMSAQRDKFLGGGPAENAPKTNQRFDRLRILASLAVDRIIKPPTEHSFVGNRSFDRQS